MAPVNKTKPPDINDIPGLDNGRVSRTPTRTTHIAVQNITAMYSGMSLHSPSPSRNRSQSRALSQALKHTPESLRPQITAHFQRSQLQQQQTANNETQGGPNSNTQDVNARDLLVNGSSNDHSDRVPASANVSNIIDSVTTSQAEITTNEPQNINENLDESKFSLLNFFNPVIPESCQSRLEGETVFFDDWHQIDLLSVNECLLSIGPTLKEVPLQHKYQFAKAMETCFKRFQRASEQQNSKDIERALKWFLVLPHMLLSTPTRGGKAGTQIIKRRFDCVVSEKFGRLIEHFQQDREIIAKKNLRRKNASKSSIEDPEKTTRLAISLISHGRISKCANRINSFGVVDINNPVSKNSLMSKYPARGRQLPSFVSKGTAVDSFRTIQNALMNLKVGVAPGTGGFRPEFLLSLTDVWKEDEHQGVWDMVNYFCMQYISGGMPPWFYKSVMTVETVGLFKTAERNPEKLRPIGMRNPFIKTIHKETISQNRHIFKEYLEPQQLGMSVGGAAKLVHSVRMTLEKNPSFICVKLDFKNAFNEISRARVVEALEEEESLRHLAQFAGILLAPVSGLESGGEFWGEAQEGTTQGDPLSGPFFCVSIHKEVRKADYSLQNSGGMVRCGWDDGYFLGPKEVVFQALNEFSMEVHRSCGLVLQVTKSEVYNSSGVMPSEAPVGFVKAGAMVMDEFQPGFLCYGVPIGTDEYVIAMLDLKMKELEDEVENMYNVLESSRQSMWAMLRSSISQRLDYWLTLVYPSQMKKAAARMDNLILSVIQKLLGCPIPMEENYENWNCPINVSISGLKRRSFQNWILRLPIRLGGLGIRSNLETSPAAFIGGVEQALPHFTKDSLICSNLEDQIGNFSGESNSRWTTLVQSGCRTGTEFVASWNSMKREVQECLTFLNKEESFGPLKEEAEGAGEGREDGGTRRLIIQQREELRVAVLEEAVSRYPDPTKRQVLAWTNRDKLCTAWLQSLPGPEGFSNLEFTEALALALCMPSPACEERVGEKVGKSVVDVFGDNIMSAVLPGDHWRTRHDTIKMALNSLCSWARLPATVEVWGLFSHLIPAEALSRFESGRARQGLVPDFRFQVPSDLGESQVALAELKVMSCCKTWYTPGTGNRVRATNKRAQGLQAIYKNKARSLDQAISGTTEGQRGPVERRLDEFGPLIGLCFGAWGEGSKDVHKMVDIFAKSRLKFQRLQEGRPTESGSQNELALIVGQIRRKLSVTAIKAQVRCLLSRLHQVGPGNKQLAKKRQWALTQDENMKRERQANWLARIEGVSTLRKGNIKID